MESTPRLEEPQQLNKDEGAALQLTVIPVNVIHYVYVYSTVMMPFL